jgi:dihydroxyacetone kinase
MSVPLYGGVALLVEHYVSYAENGTSVTGVTEVTGGGGDHGPSCICDECLPI